MPNNYETDLIFPLIARAGQLAGVDYHQADERQKTALKVLADHTRAVTYLVSDGVLPANVGRGYVLRRLIRRIVMTVWVSLPAMGWTTQIPFLEPENRELQDTNRITIA